ncbi:MAG: phage tail tape measure protein, partial [Magnetococcales bacterium]|nr:phage tail tape measure protein [Magnetococcales bacterium]
MTQESLVFTIGVDPGSIATGMAKARDMLTSSLKAMGTAAQREVTSINGALGNIKMFEGSAAKVDALRTALSAARTESERLGNAWRQTQGDLARLNGQIEAAKKALQELRAIPVNLRTEGQKAEIDHLVQSIQKLTGQASELRAFSTGFARDSGQAAQAVNRLNAELSNETASLSRLRGTLQQAGVDTGKLTAEQARLVEQMNRVVTTGRDLQKISQAKNILGLPTVPQNAEREVTRLQAAYERLRASGALSGVALAQAHTQMVQGIIAVRNGADSLVERLRLVKDQALKLAAAGALIASASKEAITFEASMANVKKVVDFETPKAFEEMRDQIVAMSREIPITVNGLAAIAYTGGQMGIAAGSMREFTELVAKMATAFNQTPEEVSAAVGKMMNVFALTVPQTRSLADAINHLGNNTNAVEKDIVEVMNRTGGMARVFGLANVETAALATTFLSMGLGPERASTAINALMRELATAPTQTADFKAALLGLGITGEQMADMIKAGPQKALTDLLTLISKLDDQTKMNTLVGLFGKQYSDEIVQVVNNMAKYNEILGLVSEQANYAGSMQKEFNERIKTTKAQLELAKNAITEAGIALGNGFLPVITLGAKVVATLAQGVANLVNAFPNLSAAVVTAVAAFSGFGALRLIWSVMSGGITALGVAVGGLTTRAIALVAPFAQVTTGWIALGSAVGGISNLMTAATARVAGMAVPVITLSGALGLLTTAARALMLTPLGIFLTAASAAAWLYSKATESTVKPLQDSAKAMGEARAVTAQKIKSLEDLKSTLEATRPGTKAHIEAEQKLASLLPGANLSIDEQGRALARVGGAAKENGDKLKAYLATLKVEEQQNFILHLDMQARAFLAARGEMTTYSDDLKSRYGFSSDQAASLTQEFLLKLDRLTGSYDSNIAKGAELRRQLGETENGFKALIQEAISTGMSLDQLDKELAKIRADPQVRAQILDMFTSMTGSITAGKTASRDLNEELKAMNATLAGPLISATQAI